MKDFTYYNDKINLSIQDCAWLNNMGLRETRWILDTMWIYGRNWCPTFKKWIGE